MKAQTLLVVSALSAMACGGAPGSFGGSAGSFPVRAALLHVLDVGVLVSLESEPRSEACAHWAERVYQPPAVDLRVLAASVGPGAYPVSRQEIPGRAPASSELTTQTGELRWAESGTLTFERLDLGAAPFAEGHFELQFEGGTSASGEFEATPCP